MQDRTGPGSVIQCVGDRGAGRAKKARPQRSAQRDAQRIANSTKPSERDWSERPLAHPRQHATSGQRRQRRSVRKCTGTRSQFFGQSVCQDASTARPLAAASRRAEIADLRRECRRYQPEVAAAYRSAAACDAASCWAPRLVPSGPARGRRWRGCHKLLTTRHAPDECGAARKAQLTLPNIGQLLYGPTCGASGWGRLR